MGKNLLQDMIKRNSTPEIKRPPSRILELTRESIRNQPAKSVESEKYGESEKVVEPARRTYDPVVEMPKQSPPFVRTSPVPEQVVLPQTPAPQYESHDLPESNEPLDYSKFETKYASVNDTSSDNDRGRRSHPKLWLVAVGSVLFLVFALSYLFSDAKILIIPKTKNVTANLDISAVKDVAPGTLSFDLMAISGETSKAVIAGPEKDVVVSAKGKVIIYNAYGTSSQPLAIDTRLEGSNGKIYKTTTPLTVPGMQGDAPGSIEASVYGAEGGPEYNSGPLDFKIFGFKGTSKYEKFYARSVGDMTGGFEGKTVDISDADRAQLLKDLRVALREKLQKQALGQIPPGFILYKDAISINTNGDNITTTTNNNTTTATLKGTLSGFIFEEKKLTQKIAENVLASPEEASQISIPNIEDLAFTLVNNENLPTDMSNIHFNLSGEIKLVYIIDNEKLISEVAGQSKKEFNSTLTNYPNIDSARLVLRPFWKTSLPDEPKNITIVTDYTSAIRE